MSALNLAAVDLGAESGRVMLGAFDGRRLSLSEAHRFASAPVRLPDGLHTDVLNIWAEIRKGLSLAARSGTGSIAGIGVDTWGVDFGLLDRQGSLVGNPYHYRNGPGPEIYDEAFRIVSRDEIFETTGIQFMPINTLFQLISMRLNESPMLDSAERLMMMPDLFNFWLSGQQTNEFSIATTSQCYDPRAGQWSAPLLQKCGISPSLFSGVIQPGFTIGKLRGELCEEAGISDASVIAPGCHDTALAVASVPAKGKHFAYISSGTWSLLGAEISSPCITQRSLEYNFTNEGGVGGTFRFLKNITGLWILQECRNEWERKGTPLSYNDLMQMASESSPFQCFIDVDDPSFASPGDMTGRIVSFCRNTGQNAPQSRGGFVRCILESLALKYRKTLFQLEEILGYELDPIHIIGGGSQNTLLCQFTADATGRAVIAGPVEATAVGNVLMQALALGELRTISDVRDVVRASFEPVTYTPGSAGAWDEAAGPA